MSEPMTQEELIQKLCETGEAVKERLLLLVEAGEESGCQMREEKDAIEAWDDIVDRTDFAWQKQLLDKEEEVPIGLRNL